MRAELKRLAREQIRGKLGILFVCMLVYMAIAFALMFVPFAGYFATLLCIGPFALSFAIIYLNITKGINPQVGDIFSGFNLFGKAFVLNLLTGIYIFLWSLLFIIPGIIKQYEYSMSFYILADHPEMTASEAIRESRRIMNGHKMDYFVLILSFIGWNLLSAFTFGIAGIYVIPYMQATCANFYNDIKGDGSQREYISYQQDEPSDPGMSI